MPTVPQQATGAPASPGRPNSRQLQHQHSLPAQIDVTAAPLAHHQQQQQQHHIGGGSTERLYGGGTHSLHRQSKFTAQQHQAHHHMQQQQQQQHFLQQQQQQKQQHHQQQMLQLHQQHSADAASDRHKFHTVPSKMMINGIIFEEAEKQMTVLPMRPLLRGYNSHVTLPTRGTRGQHLVADYCDDLAGSAASGYCSDGDALRSTAAAQHAQAAVAASGSVKYSDIEAGYMSEGGGGAASKQMQMRLVRSHLPTTIEER